jgi:hypothetical protein
MRARGACTCLANFSLLKDITVCDLLLYPFPFLAYMLKYFLYRTRQLLKLASFQQQCGLQPPLCRVRIVTHDH